MARTVKPEQFAAKRKEILEATQRLVLAKGYERMSIQDILDELEISSGAFHHYFGSREALLEAFIQQIKQGAEEPLLPIIHDPHLTALEKLQGFFGALDQLRFAHRADVVKLWRVWYTDDNAIVRQKVDEAVLQQRAPLLTEIVRQGMREGAFTTTHPDQVGEVVLFLWQGMGNTHARLLHSLGQGADEQRGIEAIIATHAAYMEAIERVLGAPPNSLRRIDGEMVEMWVAALPGSHHA